MNTLFQAFTHFTGLSVQACVVAKNPCGQIEVVSFYDTP